MGEQRLLSSGACQFGGQVVGRIVGFCVVRLVVARCGCWCERMYLVVRLVVVSGVRLRVVVPLS